MKSIPSSEPALHKGGFGTLRGRPPRMEAAHSHNDIELNFVEKGRISYLVGGRKVSMGPGLWAFWASRPHQLLDSAPGTYYQWLDIPLAWFLQWRLPRLTRELLSGETPGENRASRFKLDTILFPAWESDLGGKDPEKRQAALLEIEARLRRLESSLSGSPRRKAAQGPREQRPAMQKVEQMARHIAGHYTEPLRVSEIAASAGLNPDYAMNLFHRVTGSTMVEHLTQHRVSHAQRLLISSDQRVLDVGLESGFGSESNFYSAFKKYCGVNPKGYRASIKSGITAKLK